MGFTLKELRDCLLISLQSETSVSFMILSNAVYFLYCNMKNTFEEMIFFCMVFLCVLLVVFLLVCAWVFFLS